jgi:phosphocarrier protein HPr
MTELLSEKITIVNKLGLHARAAAKFVKTAINYSSEISLSKGELDANGKSIMGILMLAAEKGNQVTLSVKGSDQKLAFSTLKKLIKNGFGE